MHITHTVSQTYTARILGMTQALERPLYLECDLLFLLGDDYMVGGVGGKGILRGACANRKFGDSV